MQRRQRVTAIITATIGLILVLYGLFRNRMLSYVFEQKTERLTTAYNLQVAADRLKFRGIRTLDISNLVVLNSHADTLAQVGAARIKLGLLHLLVLKVNPLAIELKDSWFNLNTLLERNSIQNKEAITAEANKQEKFNLLPIYKVIKGTFGLSTAKINIDNLTISYIDSLHYETATVTSWNYKNSRFSASVATQHGDRRGSFELAGESSKSRNSFRVWVYGRSFQVEIPFIEALTGVGVYLDSAKLDFRAGELHGNLMALNIETMAKNISMEGSRIAPYPMKIDSASLKLDIKLKPSEICLDSTSTLSLNRLSTSFKSCYTLDKSPTLTLKFKTATTRWQDLVESLPSGLFTHIAGMKLRGTFSYTLKARVNPESPDSLVIEPLLSSSGFGISSFGQTNFYALNDTFTHRVYKDGRWIRNIRVSSDNPEFTPLNHISPFLKWAIITSEDGNFYTHGGFDLDGIRYALACNIRERRFARGGSTITQQLIKNLYLNQEKNIARKAEEMLMVWIIENTAAVSKDRMLEIYLNIIEWGPDVYGIAEAASYYFNKKPNELTLQESLFLAYIVPRPTKFKYLFDDQDRLKPFLYQNFTDVASKMLMRGYITENDFQAIDSTALLLPLHGRALELIAVEPDLADSVQLVEVE